MAVLCHHIRVKPCDECIREMGDELHDLRARVAALEEENGRLREAVEWAMNSHMTLDELAEFKRRRGKGRENE